MAEDYEERKLLRCFGKAVADARKSRRLTQKELALRAGLSPTLIASVETGRRWPQLTPLHQIAEDGLGMKLHELMGSVEWPEGYQNNGVATLFAP